MQLIFIIGLMLLQWRDEIEGWLCAWEGIPMAWHSRCSHLRAEVCSRQDHRRCDLSSVYLDIIWVAGLYTQHGLPMVHTAHTALTAQCTHIQQQQCIPQPTHAHIAAHTHFSNKPCMWKVRHAYSFWCNMWSVHYYCSYIHCQ